MKIINRLKWSGLALMAMLLSTSCSKTPVTEDEATCETFLLGLSYNCTDTDCTYIARIENKDGEGAMEMEIDQATYDHYKTEAEAKKENVCWDGPLQ